MNIIPPEELQDNPIYSLRITDMGWNKRITNTLGYDNIVFIGELIRRLPNDLMRTPNIGNSSIREMRETLHDLGTDFGTYAEGDPLHNSYTLYTSKNYQYQISLYAILVEAQKKHNPEIPDKAALPPASRLAWLRNSNGDTKKDILGNTLNDYLKSAGYEVTGITLPQEVTDIFIEALRSKIPTTQPHPANRLGLIT